MKNFYKPRYKICFQSKNKVYLNKNSKFRRFYNIRDAFFIRRYLDYRITLVLRNMKWNIARRFMSPRLQKRQFSRYQYGNILRNKQQLKSFYGNLKEKQFERLFKKSWLTAKQYKQEAFLGALEHRLDILLFRLRILPSIFACKQYILHHGIYVNNDLITLPHYQVKIGDIISIKEDHWKLFYSRIKNKANIRLIGQGIVRSIERKKKREKQRIIERLLHLYRRRHLKLFEDFKALKKEVKVFETSLISYILNKKNLSKTLQIQLLTFLKLLKTKLKRFVFVKNLLRTWGRSGYLVYELEIVLSFIVIKFYLNFLKMYIQFLEYTLNKKKKRKNSSLKKIFFIKNTQVYNTSLKNLEEFLMHSFRGFFLKPSSLKKQIFHKNRKRHFVLQQGRYNRNLWWLDKDFTTQKIIKNKWWWQSEPHWYIPNYLEIDYKTLRIGVVGNPTSTNVFYPFQCSFNQIISFYTDKGF